MIDPPLPVVETTGIELHPNGSGVVLIRVPQSRRRPHRHSVNKEAFVRRADEAVRISMREIQELTIQSIAEATRIETTINERRGKFLSDAMDWHGHRLENGRRWGGGFQLIGIPTTPVELVRVVGRPGLTGAPSRVFAGFGGERQVECVWPQARNLDWKPGLRSIFAQNVVNRSQDGFPDRKTIYSLQTNGVCELSHIFQANRRVPGLFAGWMAGVLGFMLAWVDRIRDEGGVSAEYALAVQLLIFDQPVLFAEYGVGSFAETRGAALSEGEHVFPIMSIGTNDEFSRHLERFDEDLWNLAGFDIQRIGPKFKIVL